ncbi:hypothetical protein [Pontibacter brevis]
MRSGIILLCFCFLFFVDLQAQKKDVQVIQLKQFPANGVLLDSGWKYSPGDAPEGADPAFDDRNLHPVDPTKDILGLPQLWQNNVVWFRLRFSADSLLRQQTLALLVEQRGASEIYLNGNLLQRLGQLSHVPEEVKAILNPEDTFWPCH